MSPFTSPRVVAVAEGIPFDVLTKGSNQRLYELKGEVLTRGIQLVLGRTLPAFTKRRFQEGAMAPQTFAQVFDAQGDSYRQYFLDQYASN